MSKRPYNQDYWLLRDIKKPTITRSLLRLLVYIVGAALLYFYPIYVSSTSSSYIALPSKHLFSVAIVLFFGCLLFCWDIYTYIKQRKKKKEKKQKSVDEPQRKRIADHYMEKEIKERLEEQ